MGGFILQSNSMTLSRCETVWQSMARALCKTPTTTPRSANFEREKNYTLYLFLSERRVRVVEYQHKTAANREITLAMNQSIFALPSIGWRSNRTLRDNNELET
jgi:hypothetical protein